MYKKIIFCLFLISSDHLLCEPLSDQLTGVSVMDQVSMGKVAAFVVVSFTSALVLYVTAPFFNFHRVIKLCNPNQFFGKMVQFFLCGREISPESMLDVASQKGYKETVAELLKYPNIDVNECTSWTVLAVAAKNGHLEVVNLLLHHPGIDVNGGSMAPLAAAVRKKKLMIVARLLKDPRVDVNKQSYGATALQSAVKRDWLEGVKLLVPLSNIHKKCYGRGLLYFAAEENCIQVFDYLLTIPDLDAKETYYSRSLVDVAIAKGHWSIVNLLRIHKKITDPELCVSLYKRAEKDSPIIMNVLKKLPRIRSIQAKDNTFFTNFVSEQRQSEGYFLAQKSFIDFCIVTKGNLNQRKYQGKRPLDLANEWYCLAAQDKSKEMDFGKAKIYHQLLKATPSWSCKTLYEQLVKKGLLPEVGQKIIETYKRAMAPQIEFCSSKTQSV